MVSLPFPSILLRRHLHVHQQHRRLSTIVDLSHLSSTSSTPTPTPCTPPIQPWPHTMTESRLLGLLRSSAQSPTTALKIFHHALHFIPNFTPSYPSYLSLIRILSTSSSPPLLSPIPSLLSSLRSSSCPCSEPLFITLIRVYSLSSKPAMALKIFLSIPTFNVTPSVRAFNAVLNAMVQNRRYNLVPILFNNCFTKFKILPSLITVNIVIKALCKLGDVEGALEVLDEMPEWGMPPNLVTYTTLIGFYCSRGDLASAKDLLEQARRKHLQPDVTLYTVLIHGFCKKGRLDEAVKVMDDMEGSGVLPNEVTYNVMIEALCGGGKSGEALNLVEDMLLDGKYVPSSSLCCKVIDALCEDGKVEDACDVWRKLLRKNVTPDNSISSSLIYWLCKAGKVREARKLFDEFDKGFIPSVLTYNTLISGMCENGELQEAARLWDDMIERRCNPNVFTYSVLIKGFCKVGNAEEGVLVLEEMLDKGYVPDKFTYGILIDGLLKGGEEEDEAFGIVRNVSSRDCEFHDGNSWDVSVKKKKMVTADSGRWKENLSDVLNRLKNEMEMNGDP